MYYLTDLAEADTYFATERAETEAWDDLSPSSQKEAFLTNAFNLIFYCREFSIPAPANATADELVILKKANCEMAYYLAIHLSDQDRRKGIQAQGVVQAGVVKEVYDPARLDVTPIPSNVRDLLAPWAVGKKAFVAINIGRDEGKRAKEVVTVFDDDTI